MERVTLTRKELKRVKVLDRLLDGSMSSEEAAKFGGDAPPSAALEIINDKAL
jgi:hypothetical protein